MLTKLDHLGMNNRVFPFPKSGPNSFRKMTPEEIKTQVEYDRSERLRNIDLLQEKKETATGVYKQYCSARISNHQKSLEGAK